MIDLLTAVAFLSSSRLQEEVHASTRRLSEPVTVLSWLGDPGKSPREVQIENVTGRIRTYAVTYTMETDAGSRLLSVMEVTVPPGAARRVPVPVAPGRGGGGRLQARLGTGQYRTFRLP